MYSNKFRLPAGDYYIRIQDADRYSNGDYMVTALYTPEPGSDYEKEFNGNSGTANILYTNTQCSGNLSTLGDVDWFRVTLTQPGSLQVKFEYPSDSRTYTWNLSLYRVDSEGKLEELGNYYNGDTSSSVNATKTMYSNKFRLSAGDYYIRIQDSDRYTNGDYTITVLSDVVADIPAPWAKAEVEAAINKRLVPEYMQKKYTQNINRNDFCYLVINLITVKTGRNINEILAAKGKNLDYSAFSDTSDPTVLAAYALGIVNGKGSNRFDPDGYITRQEAAVMLQRTANVLGFTVSDGPSVDFADKNEFAGWAVNGIAFASAATDKTNGNKVMGGTGNGRFSPHGTYTRQQAFITMIRLYNAMN